MYKEEKIINGILCYRSSPDGKWYGYGNADRRAALVESLHSLKIQNRLTEAEALELVKLVYNPKN